MSPDLRVKLADTSINDPTLNVRAAIALVFTKAVQAATTSVVNSAEVRSGRRHRLERARFAWL